jgi:hypothetical protein
MEFISNLSANFYFLIIQFPRLRLSINPTMSLTR